MNVILRLIFRGNRDKELVEGVGDLDGVVVSDILIAANGRLFSGTHSVL